MWDDLSDKIISEDNANIPDPLKDAKEEAERIKTNKFQYLTSPIKRIILDAPWIDEKELLVEVGNYYKESMSRIPSFAKYPEAKPWVEYIITRDKEVMELANLTEQEMGVLRVMNNYLTFRGYKNFGIKKRKSSSEKCRIAFLPETDMGPMHIKNLDDPIESWQPGPPLPARAPISSAPWYHQNFIIDGVGSGLHIDDEPPEIFPLPVLRMVKMHANDTISVVDFLEKYSIFWGNSNILIYDRKYHIATIEKCSRNFFEVFPVDPVAGFAHVSGMVCRNPDSPQAKYQKEKRVQYQQLFNLPDDGADAIFWHICYVFELMLRGTLKTLGRNPKSKDVMELFTSAFPVGLRKDALKPHPQQGTIEYTLATVCLFLENKSYWRWQRAGKANGGIWLEKPDICQYEM